MIEVPAGLAELVRPWASLYEDSKTVSDLVTATHLIGLLVGGGAAVTLDRETLAFARSGEVATPELLGRLARTHRWVLIGIVLLVVSGLLQTASDLKTFLPAPLFWGKLALFALLLVNGWVMLRSERDAAAGRTGRLRLTAGISLTLWIVLTLVGVFLTSIG